ncbi:N-acetylglucosamine-6-phosphate deacetylase [Bacillus sp. SA1-12]|uniref:N-acetylglucosamine-6-phosphate deacetylase n=1 Tax=Bacillus sp. SA1-12 TaxID=1455638 RepID=UPI001E5C1C0E|nr:N-acetylglucosamine-6-phosphate deacetylase [Bacillus sp. SA1-12]
MQRIAISNVQIVTEDSLISNGTVIVKDGKIQNVTTRNEALPSDIECIDGNGHLLIPGMIDLHIHGANGHDMMDGSVNSIYEVSKACAESGCTSFLATSVTSSLDKLLTMISNVKKAIGNEPGAQITGLHLEGPYLNPKRKGMQNEDFLRHPDLEEMEKILVHSGDLVKMVTIAPELPGGIELVKELKAKGIIVALAHSDATYEEAKAAFQLGASHVTHCFNGMRPIHHREPGLIIAAFEGDHVSLQAIVDGIHLHPAIVRLMHRMKGPEGVALITDALQAMGLGDGDYLFGGHQVKVENGVARLKDGTLASSTVKMNEALKKAVESGIPLWDAVMMATRTPADILGLKTKGRIAANADADLVLLDEKFNVKWTMICGKIGLSLKAQ